LLPDALKNTIAYLEKKDGNIGFSVTNIPKVFDVIESNATITSSVDNWEDYNDTSLELGNRFIGILSSYQEIGAKWLKFLYANRLGGCLADEMGLGKTTQIIALLCDAEVYTNIKGKKILIIVPKSLLQNWSKEFKKFAPSIPIGLYYGNKRSFGTINASPVCITTFQTVTKDIDKFIEIHYDCVVIDEIQNINNGKTLTSRTVKSLNAQIKFGLSGTPVENNINELITIMDIVVPGLLDTIKKNVFDENGNISKFVLEDIKRRTLPFMLKRGKKDVLLGLPQKHIETINCTMEKRQKDLYNSILLSLRNYLAKPNDRYSIKDYSNILKSLLYLRESCCDPRLLPHEINVTHCVESAKLEVLKTICQRIITKNKKLIVFSQFSKMLKIIKTELNDRDVPLFILDGSTQNRQEIVDEFESSEKGIFLISLKAGGVGLNLVSCHVGVIYDPWWNSAAEEQAIDRMHRIGQKQNVIIYKLIMKDTVEDKVRFLQDKKSNLIRTLLDGLNFSEDKVDVDLINEIIS
jgi:SNF2 family DNA or RNA helicase